MEKKINKSSTIISIFNIPKKFGLKLFSFSDIRAPFPPAPTQSLPAQTCTILSELYCTSSVLLHWPSTYVMQVIRFGSGSSANTLGPISAKQSQKADRILALEYLSNSWKLAGFRKSIQKAIVKFFNLKKCYKI